MLEIIKNENFNKINLVEYGFFTRKGGLSVGEFKSLNINTSKINGENDEIVKKNLKIIQRYFNTPFDILKLKQTHSNKVFILDNIEQTKMFDLISADSIITKLKNVPIGISTADCIPLLMTDEKNEIIAAVHVGWKGLINNIIENTVKEIEKIGGNPAEISAIIGPHLRVDNFEVKDDFITTLKNKKIPVDNYILKKENKMYFDITKYTNDKIKELNLKHIYDVNLDTYTNEDLFFSYRRTCHRNKNKFGCQFSGIILK